MESGKNKISIDKEIRYALINASINSLSANIPPELLVALVTNGLWSPIQGLTYARQMPDFWMRAKSLTALVPHLNKYYRILVIEETLAASRNVRDEDFRAEILVNLAPHLSEALLKRALIIARDIDDDLYRVKALSGFIPHLSKSLKNIVLSESLITAQNIEYDESRESALSELVPRIAELGNIEGALKIMDDIKAIDIRIEALTNFVSYLPEPLKENMLKDALKSAMRTEHPKAEMLLSLLPFLEDHFKEDAVNEVLLAAQNKNIASRRGHLLTRLLTYLSEQRRLEVLDEVLILYEKIECIESKVEWLANLIPYLSEPFREKLISEALTSTKDIYDELSRARSVAYLVPFLSEPLLLEALKITQEIRNDYQNWVLGEFALKLAQTGNPDNAIKLSQKIADDFYKTKAMIQLIPYLNDSMRCEFIENAFMDAERKTGVE
ncbi:MAG TPA: hypothetical protein PLK94_11565, partial [Alphaproteobacteria bacterium]|nr:hypothetical protein [Alphaproteobacteria bacterium]